MSNDEDYKTVAIVAAALVAPQLLAHGSLSSVKRDEYMQEAIGNARALLRLSKELVSL